MGDELAPHWQQRAAGLLGVVDMSATQRRYERTTGWALQRMARASQVLARYASSDGRGMSDDLLLARLPVVAATFAESPTGAGSLPFASSPAEVSSVTAAGSGPVVSPVPAMLARLQRRVDQPGVLSAQSLARTRSETGPLRRSALTERLNARGAAVPGASAPTLPLARRLDSAPQDQDVDRYDDSVASPAAASTPSIAMQSATIEHALQRTPAVSMRANTTGAGAAGQPSTDARGTDATPFVPLVRVTPVASVVSHRDSPVPFALSPSKGSINQGNEPFDRLRANGEEFSGHPPSSSSTTINNSSTAATATLSRASIPESGAANPVEVGKSSLTTRAIPGSVDLTSPPPMLARRVNNTSAASPSRISDAPLAVVAGAAVATSTNQGAPSAAGQNAASQSTSQTLTTAAGGGPSGAAPAATTLPMATIARHIDEPGVSVAMQGEPTLTLRARRSAVETTSLPAVPAPALDLAPPITPLASPNIARRGDTFRVRADASPATSLTLRGAHSDATESSASIVRETAGTLRSESSAPTSPVGSVLQRSPAAATPGDSPALTLHAPLTFVAERSSAIPAAAVTAANPSVTVSPAVLARTAGHATATLPRVREVVPAVNSWGEERALSLSQAPNAVSNSDTNTVQSAPVSGTLMGSGAARGSMPAASSALIWRSPQVVTSASESTSSRGGEQQASVMRAMGDTPSAASPASATETVTTVAASLPNATAPPTPDVQSLAEQVMRLITRRLEVERDRRGGKRWR